MFLALLLALAPQDPFGDLRSKDPEVRLEAVEAIAREGQDKARKALIGVLDDEDWGVVEAAARGLAVVGGGDAIEPLVALAVDGPVLRLRVAATEGLAALDPAAAARLLGKAAGSKQGVRALEALGRLGPAPADAPAGQAVAKALRSKDEERRRAAARALMALAPAERPAALAELAAGADVAAACAALEAAAAHPAPWQLDVLTVELERPGLCDVLERRLLWAIAAAAGAADPAAVRDRLEGLAAGGAEPAARGMRLLAMLGEGGPAELGDLVRAQLGSGLDHPAPEVRAAALHTGARLRSVAALARAVDLAVADPSPRVRRAALQALVDVHARDRALRAGPDAPPDPAPGELPAPREVAAVAAELLRTDGDPGVRELAAVALGAFAFDDSVAALGQGLDDEDWAVAACAAVSLGQVGDAPAVPALEVLLDHPDWRRRGAAVVGLTKLNRPEAVPGVVRGLDDVEPAVRRAAWTWLRGIAREDLPVEREPWARWWASSPERARFVDAEAERRRREKYGYAAKSDEELFATVFQELDVVVLESRGDHIQTLLDRLGIAYRLTSGARHAEDALHPAAVYVSNCTGEVEPADLERLRWFVKTGGYLFGSCWSLTHTIAEIAPGVVRKLETQGEVVDTVEAEPAAPGSAWLEGVFPPYVRPTYELLGAHLIVVEDPERAEVLVDSPGCAARWGEGNLAVWFRDGHGLILDSVNHFELQGMSNATHLKKDDERKAWAVDRLGLSLEDLRRLRKERWWGSNVKASREVPDTSAFRFLTNFVRYKRLYE